MASRLEEWSGAEFWCFCVTNIILLPRFDLLASLTAETLFSVLSETILTNRAERCCTKDRRSRLVFVRHNNLLT